MIVTVILQNGIDLGFRLGRNSQGITDPIQVPFKGVRYGLGFVPTYDDVKMKKNGGQTFAWQSPTCTNHFQSVSMPIVIALGKEFGAFFKRLTLS